MIAFRRAVQGPLAPIALVFGAALAGCGRETSSPVPPSTSVNISNGGATDLAVQGVTITFDERVRFVSRLNVPPREDDGMYVNGHPLVVEGGVLRIGDRDYGRVETGQHAHVTSEGVLVDGELRGALP